jgi:ABC-type glycerol-3-phosphate transport system permease component
MGYMLPARQRKWPELWLYIRSSLIVTFSSIIIVLPIAILGAYALARFNFIGRKYGIIFLVLPMLPLVALLVPLISYTLLHIHLTLIPPVVFFLIFQNWFIAGMFGQQFKCLFPNI